MSDDPLDIRAYDYELPDELIASTPAATRSGSRLLAIDPTSDTLHDLAFHEFVEQLSPEDLLVVNDARVAPVRLAARRATGGAVEVFVVGFGSEGSWDGTTLTALSRSNRDIAVGEVITVEGSDAGLRLESRAAGGLTRWTLVGEDDPWALLDEAGSVPLPPYIVRRRRDAGIDDSTVNDRERYQTVYAARPGAVAAPTAGLHFDTPLLDRIRERGIERVAVTLLVGVGTFRPVSADRLDEHELHAESWVVTDEVVDAVRGTRARGGRVVAVGTTVVRALEAASADGDLRAGAGSTALFIYPGYRFRVVDALVTNFHLPRSTLLALVSAFGGHALIRRAYEHAVRERYRFYSYGDAMFVSSRAPENA